MIPEVCTWESGMSLKFGPNTGPAIIYDIINDSIRRQWLLRTPAGAGTTSGVTNLIQLRVQNMKKT